LSWWRHLLHLLLLSELLLLNRLLLCGRRLRKVRLLKKGCLRGLRELVGALAGDVLQPTFARISIGEIAARIPLWMVAAPAVC